MPSRTYLPLAALALLCPAAVLQARTAPAAGDEAAVTLRYRWKEGEVARFRSTSTTSPLDPGSAAAPRTEEKVVTQTVTKVRPDGSLTEEIIPDGASPRVSYTRDARGLVREMTIGGKPGTPIDRLFALTGLPVLPEQAVKPGDTWVYETDNPAAKGTTVRVTYVYEGPESVAGTPTRRIKATAAVDAPARVQAETVTNLDADGRLIRMLSTTSGLPSFDGPTKVVSEITRLPARAGDTGRTR